MKVECQYCGKPIARNMLGFHQREKCRPAIQHREQQKMKELQERPIETLTFGEAQATGRFDEWEHFVRSNSK